MSGAALKAEDRVKRTISKGRIGGCLCLLVDVLLLCSCAMTPHPSAARRGQLTGWRSCDKTPT